MCFKCEPDWMYAPCVRAIRKTRNMTKHMADSVITTYK